MSLTFVDTLYFIASINPRKQWHQKALEVGAMLKGDLITTEAVLIELLNFFCTYGPEMRAKSAAVVSESLEIPGVQVVEQSRESFLSALSLYNARQDKGYSLTDCMSMNTMRELQIADVLTHDHHFTQEGFNVLL
ncbi:MAG: PIN domain-containing protein [Acidobacteriota bacterium]